MAFFQPLFRRPTWHDATRRDSQSTSGRPDRVRLTPAERVYPKQWRVAFIVKEHQCQLAGWGCHKRKFVALCPLLDTSPSPLKSVLATGRQTHLAGQSSDCKWPINGRFITRRCCRQPHLNGWLSTQFFCEFIEILRLKIKRFTVLVDPAVGDWMKHIRLS